MIAIACDKAGVALRDTFIKYFEENNLEYKVFCPNEEDYIDYPFPAEAVAKSVASGECEKGFLICGTGIGMSIAANKVKGIRASVCSDVFSAEMTRRHNNSNILCIGARVIGVEVALQILKVYLNSPFEAGSRHERRVNEILDLEEKF